MDETKVYQLRNSQEGIMSTWLIYGIGFIAQLMFSARMLVQWITSEKKKKVVAPSLFWLLSIFGAFLMFIYGYLREDFAIMLGQGITYFIYIRNLQLQKQWTTLPLVVRIILMLVPAIIVVYYYNNNIIDIDKLFKNEDIPFWLLWLGIIAQLVFTFRFVYQWLYSENKKNSSLPIGFWLLSLVGSFLILLYAGFRRDPVLLVSHLLGAIIYFRNLIILHKQDDQVD